MGMQIFFNEKIYEKIRIILYKYKIKSGRKTEPLQLDTKQNMINNKKNKWKR